MTLFARDRLLLGWGRRSLVLLTFLVASCSAAPSDLPPSVQLGADAVVARQQAEEAKRAADIAVAKATAVRQGTVDAMTLEAQKQQYSIALANVTATADAHRIEQARAAKTEQADQAVATQTARAINMALAQTSQAQQATVQAQQAQATQTAQMDAYNLTATAQAATATRRAQTISENIAQMGATATVEAITRQRAEDEHGAETMREMRDFGAFLLLVGFAVLVIGIIIIVLVWLMQMQSVLVTRQMMLETRAGTVLIVRENGRPRAELVKPVELLESGEWTEPATQAPQLETQAEDLIQYKVGNNVRMIPREAPDDTAVRLARKLLRATMQHYAIQQQDLRQANRIPTALTLGWSADTWQRSVDSLKPNLTTKTGRSGGTFVANYPSVLELYEAVTRGKVVPTLSAKQSKAA